MPRDQMPLHELACRACGHSFEALVRTGDDPACPECGGRDLERLLSAFAVKYREKTLAAVASARKQRIASASHKDATHAEQEHMQEHMKEYFPEPNPPSTKKSGAAGKRTTT